ncbi:hypothetical protein FNL55_05595 [Tardiphaga sp. vice352]|nr:hypothetical protein FNL53_05745 [Tardiphaga sp. vice278]QDM20523.1 hypothetical protein FIU28_04675 [Tardiphaga sp. vice154]QDM25650.1 hypothetical protein FNL56_05495 [Tardiphaga sp. vice304]QDM30864.1 hypothetical protein FNL55_05595 [Tardiphaga sp. vice352]
MLARIMPLTKDTVAESFECPECDYSWTVSAPDPIRKASGWIEALKPPN